MRCMNAETDAACVLVNVLPTTMAGVVALLRYAVEADTDGEDGRQWWKRMTADPILAPFLAG